MKLKARKKKSLKFKECSGCKLNKDTRALNIRYQDFKKTYQRHWNDKKQKYKSFWFYNTTNYDLCEKCQTRFLAKLANI